MRRIINIVLILSVVFGYLSLSSTGSVQAQANPQLILTKSVEDSITTAQVGDTIRYRIRFECSSLVGPCGEMEITDILPVGLIYNPPPESSVPAGFTMSYNSGSRTVTITKDDDNLLDGSQYDAVLSVTVDYNFRPLPQSIANTVYGQIRPIVDGPWLAATPAYAPPILIQAVTADWEMTKSLASPTIYPTVDTDVTYRLQFCPATSSGNVPMRDVIFTDTLPAGAVFVSASNGGTETGGVVTWPNIAGPVYPPNCITRYVTIQYPSTIFTVGDNVTNTASANGDYPDSDGIIIPLGDTPDPIEHPIDPIHETPTYSKSDTGDPIGITGTGRFTLNLNTNSTNYPSNDAILIDNLPAELEVLEITSGAWSESFAHVAAYVEYSTDYGASYTAFPGQPITYNTNATYAAPAANITNLQWRFVYDPDGAEPYVFSENGLPYSWSFSTSPQIRVTPRSVATIADDAANTVMPAAVPGSTYDNCLQVSRTDSTGAPTLDPCNIEQMTVEDMIASLRVSKAETPGTGWDDLDDPNINTFTADTAILPGDTVRYVIRVELTERSSADLVNPTIRDVIPADMIFVRNGTAQLDGVDLAVQPNFTQAGNTLTWQWSSPSPELIISPETFGSHILTVEFFARVQRGQTPGTYTNDLIVLTDSDAVECELPTQITDTTDIDGDSNTTEYGCQAPDTYVVERSAALRGEKWVRATDPLNATNVDSTTFLPDASCPDGGTVGLFGGGSNTFTRYPCIAQVVPEGALEPGDFILSGTPSTTLDDYEYNLRIFNDGNVPMLQYVLYDILPYVGDTGSGGTLSGTARDSEFRAVLRGPVEFISGPVGLAGTDFTIEYNETVNPCRPEVFNQPIGNPTPSGCDDTWVLAAGVTDWSLIRSYRIRLNNDGSSETPAIDPASTSDEVRFGVPMFIPKDSPVVGVFDDNDAVAHEIAWNSFSHVGSYDKDETASISIQDLLASEPRKVGVTLPEVLSVGNRVWRDSDNSGTINGPDDTAPGIANVVVNLYRDTDQNGVPDGVAIASTLTDSEGYYLFSNIPYDRTLTDANHYVIGIPPVNFALSSAPLYLLRSSTGTPSSTTYTTPTSNVVDSADDGIDPVSQGNEVFSYSFTLNPLTEPELETDLSNNDRDGPEGRRRGLNGEIDENSDLTIDFGFFGGTDIPFSIGNHVWYDNGTGSGGVINDGIRQSGEPPVDGVEVRLYRDGNFNGVPDVYEMIRTDVTDENGFYLFDNLDPGPYYVEIPATEFAVGAPLAGWYSSQTTGTENVGVTGNTNTPLNDSDDNGVDSEWPETYGIYSGVIVLTRGTPETTGESHISNEADPDSNPATPNLGINPTEWDGPDSRGRYGESDVTSNLTVDFGFIPPMSLGNRVWIDEGAGTTPFRAGFNNGLQDGTEVGVTNIQVQLWRDANNNDTFDIGNDVLIRSTTTDASGYYLFDRLQPGDDYFVHIPLVNFTSGQPLYRYVSSYDSNQITPPADDTQDMDDNGIDNAAPATNGITSSQIEMAYNTEPVTPTQETDISTDTTTYGVGNMGLFGQTDTNSNLTLDFGFVRPPRSLGNYLWLDANNDGAWSAGELPVPAGVRVSLYMDTNNNGVVDDLGTIGNYTDDWIAFDLTDANGYYLFDNLPAGRYIVGVDYTNFVSGSLLDGYNSSTGSVNNSTNNTDSRDNGVDRLYRANPTYSPYGIITNSINLTATPVGAPTGETGSGDNVNIGNFSNNPTAWDGDSNLSTPAIMDGSRGRNGELDNNSDLTIDFGFFQPMSIGNRVFRDDGAGGGGYNNGIMDGTEAGIAGVTVELFRDTNADGVPDGPRILYDTTDSNGYYLFDNVAAGSYVIRIPSSNFTGVLTNLISSNPTGSENSGVSGNPYMPNTDRDDNGINAAAPTSTGVLSSTILLVNNNEPSLESELSGQADTGAPANIAFNPTGWDGPASIGRFEENDGNSNVTIDFGFVSPPRSLGNYLWLDANNDGAWSAGELPVPVGVRVSLYRDSNGDGVVDDLGVPGVSTDDWIAFDETDDNGYYLFDNLPPDGYIVGVDYTNFIASGRLEGYNSSTGSVNNASNNTDSLDNGVDRLYRSNPTYSPYGIITNSINLTTTPVNAPTDEALSGDTSITAGNNPTAGDGSGSIGRNGELDANSDLTIDFGFFRPMSIGNRVFIDSGDSSGVGYNNGIMDSSESGVSNVRVELYRGASLIGFDITDLNGYYLFDNISEGTYTVRIPVGNFTDNFDVDGSGPLPSAIGALFGLNSSTLTGTEDTGIPGNPNTPNTDRDDNGINAGSPEISGIQSGPIVLEYNNEPVSESELSGEADSGAPTNIAFNPTGWDGPTSYGRFEEADNNSNITVDFGFVPVFSLGNRVWFDTNNSGTIDGTEVGVGGVTVQLFDAAGTTEIPVGPDGILETADDAEGGILTDTNGYYLFNNLLPGNYTVVLPASNFNTASPSHPLAGYWSSGTSRDAAGTLSEAAAALSNSDTDSDDNGMLQSSGTFTGGVIASTVTLGPDILDEPESEGDLAAPWQGQPDRQANMTVDFGFYHMRIGDLVWGDVNNNGVLDGSTESGIPGVTVELWPAVVGPTTTALASTITDSNGEYNFEDLPAGTEAYIVRIPALEFQGTETLRNFRSSTGGGTEPAQDTDANFTDSDDNGEETNGILGLGGVIQTKPITLSPGAEQTFDDTTGLTTEYRVDFGVYNNPQVDLAVTKDDGQTYFIADSTLNYTITFTNNGPADVTGAVVSDTMPSQIDTWTWTCDSANPGIPADYGCDGGTAAPFSDTIDLPYGASLTYTVAAHVLATATGQLDNTAVITPPSGTSETDTDNNSDTDTDQPASLTINKDDGVTLIAPDTVLTYHVIITNTGTVALDSLIVTDNLPDDVTFIRAYRGIVDFPPTISAGDTLTWNAASFGTLASGATFAFDIEVRVNNSIAVSSITNPIEIEDTDTGASDEDDDTDNLINTNIKVLTGTSETDSGTASPALPIDPEPVFIGEVLTYTVKLDIPAGTAHNLQALDVLDSGLAFVRCVSVDDGSSTIPATPPLTTDRAGGFAGACTSPTVSAEPVGSLVSANQGRRVQFDFGNVTSTAMNTLTITYEAVVLDIATNINGVGNLNNHVTWSWDTISSISDEATPVEIDEPQLVVEKTAQPTTAMYGTPITFTLQVSHAAISSAPAYDVILTDVLPAGLAYIPLSATSTGLAPNDMVNIYNPATSTLTFVWDVFPLAATSTITFQATFVGPSPVANEASLEWTSIEIDPQLDGSPVPRSPYNIHGTERWYDPLDQTINDYRAADNVRIQTPENILPLTGFALGKSTVLPLQPEEKTYTDLGKMWLEIPKLKLKMPITGVPYVKNEWDLTWLSDQAGYLEGSTFPGQVGNTAITAHVVLADGTPGPFQNIEKLLWGDQIILHINGEKFIYELRQSINVLPSDYSLFRYDGYTWVTLITCDEYDKYTDTYLKRTMVKAVLVKTELE